MGRYAVLSDIHGNILALEAVMKDIQGRGVDKVINLGDHASGPLWPLETISFLMKQDWVHIAGNHDKNLVIQSLEEMGESDRFASEAIGKDEKEWLMNLPEDVITPEGFRLFHGTPSDSSCYLCETVENGKVRLASQSEIADRLDSIASVVILCGHSHIPRVIRSLNGQLIINPGSVGCPAYDDDTPEYHVVESGSPHARYAIIEFGTAIETAELISVSYNNHLAADRAARNNRPDWERALRMGYFVWVKSLHNI